MVAARIETGDQCGGSIPRVEVYGDRRRSPRVASPEREAFDGACQVVVDRRLDSLLAEQDDLAPVGAAGRFRARAVRTTMRTGCLANKLFLWKASCDQSARRSSVYWRIGPGAHNCCSRRTCACHQQTQAAQNRYTPHRSLLPSLGFAACYRRSGKLPPRCPLHASPKRPRKSNIRPGRRWTLRPLQPGARQGPRQAPAGPGRPRQADPASLGRRRFGRPLSAGFSVQRALYAGYRCKRPIPKARVVPGRGARALGPAAAAHHDA